MLQTTDIHSRLLDAISDARVREQVARIIELCLLAMQGVETLDQSIFQKSLTKRGAESFSDAVLCVLSNEQREEYRDELAGLAGRGVELIFEDDPDVGLARVLDLKPWLVIVGLEIGAMEGLEFVAFLMRKYPNFDRRILVLPNKGDPFPPVLQSRDTSTGKSRTENVSLAGAWELLARTADELQQQERAADQSPYQRSELEALAKSMLAGVRALESHLKTLEVELDDSDDDAGADDFEFDLGGPSEPEEMTLDDDDIAGALGGLTPKKDRSSQERWSKLSVEICAMSYAVSSELRDFDRRFQKVLDKERFQQAWRDLCSLGDSMVDAVFALMGIISETYLGQFDRDQLLPGHRDALGKALLVRRGLTELRHVVSDRNRLIQDSSRAQADRVRARGELGDAVSSFLDGEVFAAMRPADRLELMRFDEGVAGSSPKEAAVACEGLDKYLDSLVSVNRRDVLIKHDRDLMSEVANLLEGVGPLIEISPHGAMEMVWQGFAKAEALFGNRDALDDLLREWREQCDVASTPAELVGMGSRLAALLGPR